MMRKNELENLITIGKVNGCRLQSKRKTEINICKQLAIRKDVSGGNDARYQQQTDGSL